MPLTQQQRTEIITIIMNEIGEKVSGDETNALVEYYGSRFHVPLSSEQGKKGVWGWFTSLPLLYQKLMLIKIGLRQAIYESDGDRLQFEPFHLRRATNTEEYRSNLMSLLSSSEAMVNKHLALTAQATFSSWDAARWERREGFLALLGLFNWALTSNYSDSPSGTRWNRLYYWLRGNDVSSSLLGNIFCDVVNMLEPKAPTAPDVVIRSAPNVFILSKGIMMGGSSNFVEIGKLLLTGNHHEYDHIYNKMQAATSGSGREAVFSSLYTQSKKGKETKDITEKTPFYYVYDYSTFRWVRSEDAKFIKYAYEVENFLTAPAAHTLLG